MHLCSYKIIYYKWVIEHITHHLPPTQTNSRIGEGTTVLTFNYHAATKTYGEAQTVKENNIYTHTHTHEVKLKIYKNALATSIYHVWIQRNAHVDNGRMTKEGISP